MPLLCELHEHTRVGTRAGGRLLLHRQAQLLEEHHAQLLVRGDVELLASRRIDLLFDLATRRLEPDLERAEPWQVDGDAGPLHLLEHLEQRDLDVLQQGAAHLFGETRLEQRTQPQCDVTVGACEVACACDRHGVVRDLLPTLPTEVLDARHRDAEELDRERIDRMRATAGIEHVAREHRVEVESCERNAGAAQHEQVEFRVVRRLSHRWVGEQRAQLGHLIRDDGRKVRDRMRALRECSRRDRCRRGGRLARLRLDGHLLIAEREATLRLGGKPMGERQVPRLAWRGRDAHRNEIRAQRRDDRRRIRIGDRLRTESDHADSARFRDHLGDERRGIGDAIGRRNGWRCAGNRREMIDEWRAVRRFRGAADRAAVRGSAVHLQCGRACRGIELELDEEVAQRRPVRRLQVELLQLERDGQVRVQRDEPLREACRIGVCLQCIPQPRRFDLLDVLEHRLDRAPLLHQRERALLADALHARDIVGLVADECEIVDDPLGRHAETFLHVLDAVPLLRRATRWPVPWVQHPHAGAHELQQVLVTGDDAHLVAEADTLNGERRNDVIGLESVERERGNAIAAEDLFDTLDPGVEILLLHVGQRDAVRLVRLEQRFASRRTRVIDPHEMIGLVLLDQPFEKITDALRHAGVLATRVAQRRAAAECMKRAIDEGVAVDQV